ncbi:HupE/UreJ family protein [Neobacillus terrae]|uniref:HupE/UreJ family protein n=1 Tax=Neobacillus terrae TaxID=3034837 RepID=UPI0014077626|nr:HupE/UreJ family protein [Neobacillus terrae]NHM33323.1 HupE/UreJ family protein [Neobacillus terrae]
MTQNYRKIAVFVLLACLLFPREGFAHAFSAAFNTLNLSKNTTEMIYSIDALSVIEGIGGDKNDDGKLSEEELKANKIRFQEWVEDSVVLEVNGKQQAGKITSLKLEKTKDKDLVTLTFKYPAYTVGDTVKLLDGIFYEGSRNFDTYTDFLKVNSDGQVSEAVLQGKNREWTMQISENQQEQQPGQATTQKADTPAPTNNTTAWSSFLALGAKHILTGYDHLLFLFALLLRRQTLKQYITTITAFTIAHSITLTLAVVGIADLPSRIVESLIAFSICYVALENIFRKQIMYRWAVTFFFGLIHGLGFATILREMSLPKSHLAIALINFNVGIELIQLLLVIIIVPILMKFQGRMSYRKIINGGSVIIFLLGFVWLIQRLFF